MGGNSRRVLRVMRSKQVAKRSYDRLSRWYDMLAASSEWRYTQVGLQMLAAKQGEHVLEIGFGTGNALLALAKDVARVHAHLAELLVVFVDPLPEPLVLVQQLLGLNLHLDG